MVYLSHELDEGILEVRRWSSMGKTLQERATERLNRIAELQREMAERQAELYRLIGFDSDASKPDRVPEGFPLGETIVAILRENGGSLRIPEIVTELQKRHGFRPDRRIVQSSVTYQRKKGTVSKAEGAGYQAK